MDGSVAPLCPCVSVVLGLSKADLDWEHPKDLLMEGLGKSWNIMENHGTSWKVMEHHGESWKIMGYVLFDVWTFFHDFHPKWIADFGKLLSQRVSRV
jgi:hypothetical protein